MSNTRHPKVGGFGRPNLTVAELRVANVMRSHADADKRDRQAPGAPTPMSNARRRGVYREQRGGGISRHLTPRQRRRITQKALGDRSAADSPTWIDRLGGIVDEPQWSAA